MDSHYHPSGSLKAALGLFSQGWRFSLRSKGFLHWDLLTGTWWRWSDGPITRSDQVEPPVAHGTLWNPHTWRIMAPTSINPLDPCGAHPGAWRSPFSITQGFECPAGAWRSALSPALGGPLVPQGVAMKSRQGWTMADGHHARLELESCCPTRVVLCLSRSISAYIWVKLHVYMHFCTIYL